MCFIAFSLLLHCQAVELYRLATSQSWKVTVAFSDDVNFNRGARAMRRETPCLAWAVVQKW